MDFDEVEERISYLIETIQYIIRYYAEEQGFDKETIDKITQEATHLLLRYIREKRKRGKSIGISFEKIAKRAILLAARKKSIPIPDTRGPFRLLRDIGGVVPCSPIPYIEWIGNKLGLPAETLEKAKEIAQEYRTRTFMRPSPRVLASSAIYIACLLTNCRKTQEEIAKVALCTEVSIRNNYKKIAKLLNIKICPVTATHN